MSEGDLSDGFQKPKIKIHIKNLMGTVLNMDVSPKETIADIKKKIYRIEGIPTFHQNLVFHEQNLKDSYCVGDAGITGGSTLILVTSMRGGPISTRRLSINCDNHVVLKELKELLENSREAVKPGSKVSVLVFKEGEIINLLRVIENDDGTYSPYNEKPISPPSKPTRRGPRLGIFERFVEDTDMSKRMANLRKKMEELRLRKRGRGHLPGKPPEMEAPNSGAVHPVEPSGSSENDPVSFKFLTHSTIDMVENLNLKVYEKNSEEDNEEEIALKDKHRSKPHKHCDSKTRSLFSESRGASSSIKQNYTRLNKKSNRSHAEAKTPPPTTKDATELAEKIAVLEEATDCGEPVLISAPNRIHLARLILSSESTSERPKSSADSLELEENVQDLWPISEGMNKHGAACEVGLMKRRQSLDYVYENSSNFELCSGNFYFTKANRSPLYCRSKGDEAPREVEEEVDAIAMVKGCSGIRRVGELLEARQREHRRADLPPVTKKKARCNQCNRRLNVTNIHSCRCGKIFCSQHRYSEVHQCTYDYKLEGRKLLQQQNPLVDAEKIHKI